jgi:glycosyl transferase-like sugar-binding protein
MFWAQGGLSNLERMSCNSFLRHGYKLNLWSYSPISNVPAGVILKDAREILPEQEMFCNANGSYAGFSDVFRYAVLNKIGGLWADTDIIALKPASYLPDKKFLVSEWLQDSPGGRKINGNLIYNPRPEVGNVIDLALAYSMRFPKIDLTWSEIGPDLLSAIVLIYPKHDFLILSPDFSNSINHWDCPSALLEPDRKIVDDAVFLHCYNETWRRSGIDKNSSFHPESIMGGFARQYLT